MRSFTVITLAALPVLLCAAINATGCGSADGRDILAKIKLETGTADGDAADTESAVSDEPEAELVDLGEVDKKSTTWAMLEKLYISLDFMDSFGVTKPMTIKKMFLVTMGDDLKLKRTACYFDMGPLDAVAMWEKNEVDQSKLPLLTVPDLTFTEGDQGAVSAADYAWVWGAHLQNPVNPDDMPSENTDTRLFDQDDDGKDAVTVSVYVWNNGTQTLSTKMGDRYMVRRTVKSYAGQTSEDGDWITGSLTFWLDDFVTGTSTGGMSSFIKASPPQSQDTSKTSPFVMRRMPQDTTCEDILTAGEGLFVR